jgi:hypothetical protein
MLPQELIDEIIALTDIETIIKMGNVYAFRKMYNKKKHTLEWAVINNKKELVKLHIEEIKMREERIKPTLFIDAVWHNYFDIADLLEKEITITRNIIEECCCYRCDLPTVLFLESKGYPLNNICMDLICGCSDLETFCYLLNKGYKITKFGIKNTLSYGKIEIFEEIIKHLGITKLTSLEFNLMDLACEYDQLDMMKYLYQKYNILGSNVIIQKAIFTRNSELINWVKKIHAGRIRPTTWNYITF